MRHFPSPDIGMFGRRQRHPRGHRIPIGIVGGSAGTRSPDTLMVVDHFGADDVIPLPGGCPCCTVRDKFQVTLGRLLVDRKNKSFSRVTIETSNDLAPILRTFATERALGAEFYVEHAPALPQTDGIHTFVLTEDTPLSWNAVSRFISTLKALRGPDLLHVKGLLNVEACRGPIVMQFMQHLSLPPVELQAWPDDDRASHMEFVTRNVTEKSVRDLFDSVRALA